MFSNFMSNSPILSLAPTSGSFPFQSKHIHLTGATKVILGLEATDTALRRAERASPSNGWFAARVVNSGGSSAVVAPLPLSQLHAEVWVEDGQVFIRDLDSPFGTYVNDARVKNPVVLKKGDTISLGHRIARNSNTPSYITDDHLKPIVARISLTGVW